MKMNIFTFNHQKQVDQERLVMGERERKRERERERETERER